jgi:hypothetical protein
MRRQAHFMQANYPLLVIGLCVLLAPLLASAGAGQEGVAVASSLASVISL